MCEKECIQVSGKAIRVMESACAACLLRAKRTPDNAVRVVQLPAALVPPVHAYGTNAFHLHGLPMPKRGQIVGLIGANGIGKSTALKILSASVKPNLGVGLDQDPAGPNQPSWSDVVKYFRGSELQRYFTDLLEDSMTCSVKAQLDRPPPKRVRKQTVSQVLDRHVENAARESLVAELDLGHLLGRKVGHLSGGELQRLAICCTCLHDRDVYMFDEVSSVPPTRILLQYALPHIQHVTLAGFPRPSQPSAFLDLKQRLAAMRVIRSVTEGTVNPESSADPQPKYAIVIDHDLCVMDYVSDVICCMYGQAACFGCVSKPMTVGNGINNFLAGTLPTENVRFRKKPLQFQAHAMQDEHPQEGKASDSPGISRGRIQYPAAQLRLEPAPEAARPRKSSTFALDIEPGSYESGRIIGLLGQNGCGKSTFIGHLKEIFGSICSLKPQRFGARLKKFAGTVTELLEQEINKALADRMFRLQVLTPLGMPSLADLKVKTLSGGQLQRLAIVLCLGHKADIYLLDEPSAFLDCEQRAHVTRCIRSWIITHSRKAAFIVEHDMLMASALYDQVVVFTGVPGVACTASAPLSLAPGLNAYLAELGITMRRDPTNCRPRINKKHSYLDREQKESGEYFVLPQ